MAVSQKKPVVNRITRMIVSLTIATCFAAAFAARPSASTINDTKPALVVSRHVGIGDAMRPLGSGTAIRVGRAYDAEDEDCTMVVTKTKDPSGHLKVTRGVTCAD